MFFSILSVMLPLISSVLVFLFGRFLGQNTKFFVVFNIFIALVCSVISFYYTYAKDIVFIWDCSTWFDFGVLSVNWSFLFDNISTLMILTVCLVSLCVHVYSCYYMASDPSLVRFLSYLSLFTFFMLFLLSSNNFVQFFFAWEGVGLCSYLLINFWYTRVEANRAAVKAVLVNRVGDCFLLLAVCLIYKLFNTTEFGVLNCIMIEINSGFMMENLIFSSVKTIDFICFSFCIAAMCKSAQIGFHVWLPDAMEGPTPVSALIHAATMVTAGVFLLIRSSLFFELTSYFLAILTVVGSLTALLGATAALFQYDIKKVIAYSTCSQLGYMVMACGTSRYDIAYFHLINHAFFKAVLFLSAGVIIHTLSGEQDIRRMGGLKKKLVPVYCLMLISSLALAGIPFLSGFYSKDMILGFSLISNNFGGSLGFLICFLSAIFTSFYSAKTLNLIFFGQVRGARAVYYNLHSPGYLALLPIAVLGFISILSGFYLKDCMIGVGSNFFDGLINVSDNKDHLLDFEFVPLYYKLLLLFAGLSGFIYYGFRNYITKSFSTAILNLFKFRVFFYEVYLFFGSIWYSDYVYSKLSSIAYSLSLRVAYFWVDKGLIYFFTAEGLTYIVKQLNVSTVVVHRQGFLHIYILVTIISILLLFLTGFYYF